MRPPQLVDAGELRAIRDDNNVETEFLLGEAPPGTDYRPFEDLLDADRTAPPDRSRRGSDPMSTIYISGTTGKPKGEGAILPHYSYLNTGWEFVDRMLSIGSEDRLFTTLPLSHCNAQQLTVTGSILAATDFVLYPEFDPEKYWDQIRRHDVTMFNYLGAMITNHHNTDERPDDADNSAEYGRADRVTIRTDRPRRINDLAIEVGQHLLEVRALQIDRITAPRSKIVDDLEVGVDVESAHEPAAVAFDSC